MAWPPAQWLCTFRDLESTGKSWRSASSQSTASQIAKKIFRISYPIFKNFITHLKETVMTCSCWTWLRLWKWVSFFHLLRTGLLTGKGPIAAPIKKNKLLLFTFTPTKTPKKMHYIKLHHLKNTAICSVILILPAKW